MKRWVCVFCAIGFLNFPLVAADVDLNDDLLISYLLTSENEAAFKLDDGQISSFWDSWDGRDYIDMNVHDNLNETKKGTFDGPEDAGMVIKSAFNSKGIYLYAKVIDNVWQSPTDFSQIGIDAVDLYLDSRTREEIMNTPADDMATPWNNALTKTSKQIQVWMAGQNVNYQHFDKLLGNWVGIASLGGVNSITLEEAQEQYDGLGMEIVEVDATTRIQEWFIPWVQLDINFEDEDLAEFQIAFSGGYNDNDGADNGAQMRWLKADPWTQGPRENPDDPNSPIKTVGACECPEWAVNSWGHIDFSSTEIGVQRFSSGYIQGTGEVVKTGYYNLRGEKLTKNAKKALNATAIIIERRILSNGTSYTQRIRFHK